MRKIQLRLITECGMLIAASLALSMFKLIQLPSGGSVSLGCIPLIIIAARRGPLIGIICGALFGCLMLLNRPTIVHPLQFLLDYPLAYGSMGIAGIFSWNINSDKNNKLTALKTVTATTAANFLRLLMHVIAGAVFFMADKATAKEAFFASFIYNLGHLLPEAIICIAFAWIITINQQLLCARQNN